VAILRVHDCPSEHLATLVDGRPAPTAARGPQGSHKPHHNSRERGCAESEAAAIVTKVTVGQYVKLQVWTTPCRTWPSCRTGLVCMRCSRRLAAPGTCPSFARAAEADALTPKAGCLRHDLDDARHCYAGWSKPMLAALHALVLRSERVLIVEDSRELALDPPHAIRLEGRPPNW
jgi:hypothetical protein